MKSSAANRFGTLERVNGNSAKRQNGNVESGRISTTPAFQRRSNHFRKLNFKNASQNNDPIYEEFCSSPCPSSLASNDQDAYGTTFVELIKRKGTKLGVIVSGSVVDHGLEPRIAELSAGSWAQRSDVLCVGDIVVSINGVSTATMTQKMLSQTFDKSDRIQLEVRYPLPPHPPPRSRYTTKVIQVTLKKQNGSFGMVIRGGMHEIPRKTRSFTVVHMTPAGPAYSEGTIRVNDRIRAVNGQAVHEIKLPELQSLLYQQDKETVFTVEYDVAIHERLEYGPVLVEIRKDVSDILGFGVNKCNDSGHIFIESIKQASLSDRCGAMHVGDILLSVDGRSVTTLSAEETTNLIRGDPDRTHVVQLEILPGMFSKTFRSSLPSPCFSSLRSPRLPARYGRQFTRYQSMTDIDQHLSSSLKKNRPPIGPGLKERRKYVTFTVELQRDGGPLGLTLATEADADSPGPIFISSLLQDGLAERTQTIQINDQLVEINGQEVKGRCLNEVIPLLQESTGDVIKLKLARLINIPERDFATLRRTSRDLYASFQKPPLPSPSPSSRPPIHLHRSSSSRRSSSSSTATMTRSDFNHSPTPTNAVSLIPIASSLRSSPSRFGAGLPRPIPTEVHKVTLFKDRIYEDFGFSVSDGLYEKGIFLNRIRKGGPADVCGLLKPLDRILQINDTRTGDFDCCLAVPLIAAAGDKIDLLIARSTRIFPLRDSGHSQDNHSDLDEALEITEAESDASTDLEMSRTLTRRGQQRRNPESNLKRLSRTNSADGRLGGSVTNDVMPWSHGAGAPAHWCNPERQQDPDLAAL